MCKFTQHCSTWRRTLHVSNYSSTYITNVAFLVGFSTKGELMHIEGGVSYSSGAPHLRVEFVSGC